MKKYIRSILIIIIALSGVTLNSCQKDADVTTTLATGTLMFHLHTNVDTAEVGTYGSVYLLSTGRKISVTKAQLYITNIQLVKLDGSTSDVTGVTLLKKQENEVYMVGSVPAGNYKSVKFNVGLNPTMNAAAPAAGDSTLNQPTMWFGATAQPSGFVFVNFQGTIDTTAAGTGSIAGMQPFSYKIGTNSNLKSVTLPDQNFTVTLNQVQYVHMIADYSKLFNGIQLNINSNLTMNTTAANATSLGTQLSNNIPSMFRYEY